MSKPLTTFSVIIRFAAIGAVLAGTAAIFAGVAGWFRPQRLTQQRMADAFLQVNGSHPGFRLNHAKGICVTGWFDSSGKLASVSKAAVFEPGRTPVIGRFSLPGGMPFQPDKPSSVHALALRFLPGDAQEWRTANLDIPVFPVESAQSFYEQLLASAPDAHSGMPDPSKMKAFLAGHPESAKALELIGRRASSGFAESTYNGLNAFRLVNASGASVAVRWRFVPLQPAAKSAPGTASSDKNYLFDDLIARVRAHPLQWELWVTVAQPGDPTNDATLPWPSERPQLDAGVVTIDDISSEAAGNCDGVNFDPLVLPSGIEASDDPLLSARSAVYAQSFRLRAGAQHDKAPSAVTAEEVRAMGHTP